MPNNRPDPSPSFRFKLEIGGLTVAHFTECSGLEFEQEVYAYKEGGLHSRTHQLPGRFKFANLVLKKGIATDGQTLWDWVTDTVKGPDLETRQVTVVLWNATGDEELRRWVFVDAYPVKWSASALSASQNAIAISTLTLAHQGMQFAS